MSAERPVIVTVAVLRAATWTLASHLNMGGGGHHFTYSSADFPEALVCKGWRKEDGARKGYAHVQVTTRPGWVEDAPLGDLDEVARLITKARQTVVDDAAWDAADPARASA